MVTRAASTAAAVAVLAGCWIAGLGATAAAAQPSGKAVTSLAPADLAVLAVAPAAVELAVSGTLAPAYSHVVVVDGDGRDVSTGEPAPSAGDTTLRLPVEITSSGDFAVAYHLTFVDGDELSGIWSFSVGTGVPPAAAGEGPDQAGLVDRAESEHAHGVDPVGATLLVIDGLVVVAFLIMLRLRPKAGAPAGERPDSPGE